MKQNLFTELMLYFDVCRTWKEVVQKDCEACKLNREVAMDRSRWRKLIKND